MILKLCELVAIFLTALVSGMFFGPWAALTISMRTFEPVVFLAIVGRLNKNMAAIMTPLMPATLLSLLSVLFLTYAAEPRTFYLTIAALFLLLTALIVTMRVEVPIVHQVVTWTPSTLPTNWQQLRDRWSSFHIVRIVSAFAALILLLVGFGAIGP